MEFLSQYDYKFNYVSGVLNTAADALSRIPHPFLSPLPGDSLLIAARFLSKSFSILYSPTIPSTSGTSSVSPALSAASLMHLDVENTLLKEICAGSDPFIIKLCDALCLNSMLPNSFSTRDGLFCYHDCLVVPNHVNLQEHLFYLAHNQLGHFGVNKSYANLCFSFY
ncbi:hypothetical protein Agabi119p4_5099 [Agaricus bisporus var. burnettii]|uniref:Integrase zinc-binding domain-containing protein n=1 Tax=Agaricus bisporus var. burnettii TaxID=192524 RepID=A0A8H7F4H8_AGABI|nr:hypothetical protein Agabi119p4_5099 [Agaricus bisporus var. burnettii]